MGVAYDMHIVVTQTLNETADRSPVGQSLNYLWNLFDFFQKFAQIVCHFEGAKGAKNLQRPHFYLLITKRMICLSACKV